MLAFSQPPLGEPAHPDATYAFTALMAVAFVAMVGWSLWVARRERTWVPIACLLGGVIAFGYEPVLDSVAHIFYPLGSPLTFVTLFDTTIPVFVLLAWVFWAGAGTFLMSRYYDREPAGRDVLKWFLVICVLEAAFEYPAVLSEALIYYGDQPLKIAGFPWYWTFANTAPVFFAGYVLHLAKPHLRGVGGFAFTAMLPPFAYLGIGGGASWPIWLTLNGEVPIAIVWIAGLITIALSVVLVALLSRAVDRRYVLTVRTEEVTA